MDENKDNMVKIYSDSLSNVYGGKISIIDEEIKGYKLKIGTTDGGAEFLTETDLGDVTNTGDAFGQRIHPAYDLMDPNGSIVSTDLGAL